MGKAGVEIVVPVRVIVPLAEGIFILIRPGT
jgi:hypothetical protein